MKEYDVIVIGAGEGKGIAFRAAEKGLKTAIIDKGTYKDYIGGTCLTVGCIPTKMLAYPADVVVETERAERLGIDLKIKKIDFTGIMERMRAYRKKIIDYVKDALKNTENLDFYMAETHFTGEYTLNVNGEELRGKKIFIATGSRPSIPPLKGLNEIDYLTNESALELTEMPKSLIILGGGYVAVEFAHFFAAMGTKVTLIEVIDRLAAFEEPEIAELLKEELSKRMDIFLGTEALEFKKKGKRYSVKLRDKKSGREWEITAEKVMVATGRKSNADLLKPENTGVELDEKKYIKINEYLETSKENIWCIGDATGKQMFTHAADKEAKIAWHNANIMNNNLNKQKMDFFAVPHAIYSYPQIASIGLTEAEAKKDHDILVGKAKYSDTGRGAAMMEEKGFAKAVVEKDSRKILGFHIIGPEAPVLLQEVANVVAERGAVEDITEKMHTFPSLPDLVVEVLSRLEPVTAPAMVS